MQAKELIKIAMDLTDFVVKSYVGDLSDAEILKRPAPGCNHLAWQLGHLISSEQHLMEMICPGATISLPSGFAEQHSKEAAQSDDASKFLSKQQYLDLYDQRRQATKAALDKLSDADLDKPSPPNFEFAPTWGALFNLVANHALMHAGQFVPVRRALNKPILI